MNPRPLPARGLCPALCLSLGLAMPVPAASAPAASAPVAETPLALQAGEVRVLGIPGVARVAVGDGKILNAVSTDDREVIVFARKIGRAHV